MVAVALALFVALGSLVATGVILAGLVRWRAELEALNARLDRSPEMRSFSYRIIAPQPLTSRTAAVLPFPARRRFNPAMQELRAAA